MCHLVLLLPLLALPVFWLLPLSLAIPIYLAALIVTWLAWRFIMRALHRPVVTGAQGLIGAAGEVVSVDSGHGGSFVVRTCGEFWSARCEARVRLGDSVIVCGVRGLTLQVATVGAAGPVAETAGHRR